MDDKEGSIALVVGAWLISSMYQNNRSSEKRK